MNIKTYYYRNGGLISTSTGTSSTYGGSINGDQFQALYSGGQYYLGTFQLGSAAASQNDHWGSSPICAQIYPQPPINHYYDSSNTYVASKPTIVGKPGETGTATPSSEGKKKVQI
jgi:hypothetical protein